MGGIALAVRHLDGKAPQLYISNLRGAGSGKVEGAAQFLAKELATRQFHPGYIKGLMAEGYAGTLQVLDATAFALCRDQKLPIKVFSIFKAGALKRVVMGEDEGTLVYA